MGGHRDHYSQGCRKRAARWRSAGLQLNAVSDGLLSGKVRGLRQTGEGRNGFAQKPTCNVYLEGRRHDTSQSGVSVPSLNVQEGQYVSMSA